MSTISNYIDISSTSLIIATFLLLIVSVATKFLLDRLESGKEEAEKRGFYVTIACSVIIGLIVSLFSMFLFKKYMDLRNCRELLSAPFPNIIGKSLTADKHFGSI